jgi:hypothetical protein
MSTPVNDDKTALFATQTTTKGQRTRALAASIVREYERSDTADKAIINAIVDELLVLTP